MALPVSEFWDGLSDEDKLVLRGYILSLTTSDLEGTMGSAFLPTNGPDTDNGRKALTVTSLTGSTPKVITRAINAINAKADSAITVANAFDSRFTEVVGANSGDDKEAFASLGGNLIQVVAQLKSDVEASTSIDKGVFPWDAEMDYVPPVAVFGSDNEMYNAIKESGPGTEAGSQDPVTATEYWKLVGDDTAQINTKLQELSKSVASLGHIHVQEEPALEWAIQHNKDNINFVTMIYDDDGIAIVPSTVKVVDSNSVTVIFNEAASGKAVLYFVNP